MSPGARPVEDLAVVGAGTMGRGLAFVALAAGLKVRLADSDPEQLRAAADWIGRKLGEERGELVTGAVEEVCAGAEMAIEAVFEDVAVKSAVLATAEHELGPGAYIATNTSGIPIATLAGALEDGTRFVGMHFFNPVHRMALCEVIPGPDTEETTVASAVAVAARLGKTPVVVGDSPGFVASRLNCMLGNEALMMLESGVAEAEAIDTAARLGLNHPMGPLELLDLVGLDVRLAALRTLERAYGERFRPTRLHEELVEAGRLGVKAGSGIYEYDADGRRQR